MTNRTCSVEKCGRPVGVPGSARGMCSKHYQRWVRTGRTELAPKRICKIGGCGKPHEARGWCGMHYASWRKCGDPLATSRTERSVAIGQRFGLWAVTGPEVRLYQAEGKPRGHRAAPVKCSCPLGTERVVTFSMLFGGQSRSCGCRRSELAKQRNPSYATHGLSSHPLFDTWRKILSRCEKPTDKSYVSYGGRGIMVYPEWRDVAAFVAWVDENLGSRPLGMSLDRIDVDGNYEPGNSAAAEVQPTSAQGVCLRQRQSSYGKVLL